MNSSDQSPLSAACKLPSKVAELQKKVLEKESLLEEKEALLQKKDTLLQDKQNTIDQLLDYFLLLRKRQFGPSSEKANPDQFNLFDEAELDILLEEGLKDIDQDSKQDTPTTTNPTKKKKPIRRPLPAHYNRIEKIIDVSDEQKARMGNDWVAFGYDTSEQLAVIPRQHYVIIYKRIKYILNDVAAQEIDKTVIIAPRADQMIPKSLAHSSVIADVVTRKFVDALPFYRQAKIYARENVDLSRQTMSHWVIQCHERLLPFMALIKKQLYRGKVLHIDETRLQVLKEPDRKNTQLSYIWVYVGGVAESPVVWHQYASSRGAHVPIDFLYPSDCAAHEIPAHSLTILTDGYAAYNALSTQPNIENHAACWAHVRRKFIEATVGRKNPSPAHQMVSWIAKLYSIEQKIKSEAPSIRQAKRQRLAQPILDKMKAWLDRKSTQALPKSLLGKAVHYALGLWPQLMVYVGNGHVPIDNNPAENAVRPFVIGRKNWLFSGSPKGADASATMYTLIETAKANGLEPWAYLNYLFEQFPCAKTEEAMIALMPHNLNMADLKG